MAEITLLKPGQANEDLAAKLAAVAMKVLRFDEDLTDTFVGELKACLPSAEQVCQSYSLFETWMLICVNLGGTIECSQEQSTGGIRTSSFS